MGKRFGSFLVLSLIVLLLIGTVGCIAGSERYDEKNQATFWSGLFHGIISPVTLFITLFTGKIDMYEVRNVGWGYDCGFFLGIAIVLSGGWGSRFKVRRLAQLRRLERKWDKFGHELEREIKQEVLEAFRSKEGEEGGEEESWKEIGRKIGEKVKRMLGKWVEEE